MKIVLKDDCRDFTYSMSLQEFKLKLSSFKLMLDLGLRVIDLARMKSLGAFTKLRDSSM